MDFGVKYAQEGLWAAVLGAAWFAVGGILTFGVRFKEMRPWSLQLQRGAPGLGNSCFGALAGLAVLPTCCCAVSASFSALGMQAVQRAVTTVILECSSTHPKLFLLLVLQAMHKICGV